MKSLKIVQTGEYVAEILRKEILAGRINGGEELKQSVVAEQLGVSRMPVREAFTYLEYEGFLERLNNRHIRVVEMNKLVIRNHLRIMRGMLVEALNLLMENDTHVSELEDILNLYNDAIEQKDNSRCIEIEGNFHKTLYLLTGDKHLLLIYCNSFENIYKHALNNSSNKITSRLNILLNIVKVIKRKNKKEISKVVYQYYGLVE